MRVLEDLNDFARYHRLSLRELASALAAEGYQVSFGTLHRWQKDPRQRLPAEREKALSAALQRLIAKATTGQPMVPPAGQGDSPWSSRDLPRGVELGTPESEEQIRLQMARAGMNDGARDKVESGFMDYLLKVLARIPFAVDAYALYLFATRVKDPIKVAPAVGALLYFISPIDLVPDYIPIVGFLDDAAVIAAVCTYLANEIAPFRPEAVEKISTLKG